MKLKTLNKQKNGREFFSFEMGGETNYFFHIHGYYPWRQIVRTTQEKRWYEPHNLELLELGLKGLRGRRSNNTLVSKWDDKYVSYVGNHHRAWKQHTKCRKQWMKNL